MTAILLKPQWKSKTFVVLFLAAIGLGVFPVWFGGDSFGGVGVPETAVSGTPTNNTRLSASMALTNGQPTLFVFTPMEKCSIQYCLTEANISAYLADKPWAQLNVVGVQIETLDKLSADVPPDFLFANWNLYPTPSIAKWMPKRELTHYGWGLSDTQLVLVDADSQFLANLGSELSLSKLQEALAGLSSQKNTD